MLTPDEIAIAQARNNGLPMRDIAQQVGYEGHSSVSRKLSKPEVKAYLERLQSALISKTLNKAVGNIHNVVNNYLSNDPEGKRAEHGFKASVRLLETAGLLNSQATSIYIQQIINNQTNETPECIQRLFDGLTNRDKGNQSLLTDDSVIDITNK